MAKGSSEDKRRRARDRRNARRARRVKEQRRRAEAASAETHQTLSASWLSSECPVREPGPGIDARRVTDLADLLSEVNRIAQGARGVRIANSMGAIVSVVTESPSDSPQDVPVRCRRRPDYKPCSGRLQGSFEPGTPYIHWSCPVCHDEGWIHHWQDTQWDKGGRVGLPRIDKLVYRYGLIGDTETGTDLEETILEGPAVTERIVRLIHDNGLLGTSGVYGDPMIGDPIQVDQLDIAHDGSRTKITMYNRAILLFAAEEEYYKQVHRVCCALDRRMQQKAVRKARQTPALPFEAETT